MSDQREVFESAMQSMEDSRKNNHVFQIKLANGEDILAINSLNGWTNPVKINYMRDQSGHFNVVLTSWFVTAEKYYSISIDDGHIVSMLLAERGLAEYYKRVNEAHFEDLDYAMEMDGVTQQEITPERMPVVPDGLNLNPDAEEGMSTPEDDPKEKYTHPDVRKKLTKAMMEGRFIVSANTDLEIH